MDQIRNVFVQLGAPAQWERMGAGLSAQSDATGEVLSATTYAQPWRCALTRLQRGSWVARIDIVQASTSATFQIGVMPGTERATLFERRPVNTDATTGQYILNHKGRGIAIERNGNVTRCTGSANQSIGSLTSAAMGAGRSIWLIRDAQARTLTFRAGDPVTGQSVTVPDVDGDWHIAANISTANTRIRLVHDMQHLRALPNYRPVGIWGRLATIGVTDMPPAGGNVTIWEGRIAIDGDPTFDYSIRFAPMGRNSGSGRGIGDVVVANNAENAPSGRRALDAWLEWDVRGEPMTILRGIYGHPVSQAQVMARRMVETINEASANTISISSRDALAAALDVPWQRSIYGSGVVPSLAGKSLPTVMGRCNAVPMALTNASTLTYDIADDMLQTLSPVYDRGVTLGSGTGYRIDGTISGIQRLTNPAGLQCADVRGGLLDGAVYVGADIGDFAVWQGSPVAPRGWGREGNVSNNAQGASFFLSSAAGSAVPALNLTEWLPPAAGGVRLDLEFAAGGTGTFEVQFLDAAGAAMSTTSIEPVGRRTLNLTKPANAVRLRLQMGSPGSLIVRWVRACAFANISTAFQMLTYAACYRGNLPAEAMDQALFSALPDLINNYAMGIATPAGDSRSVASVVDEILTSMGCAAFINADGKFQPIPMRDPATLTPVLALDDSNIIGDVRVDLDQASGLSTRVSAARTHAVHSASDIADSLYATPTGRNRAKMLQSEYTITVDGASKPSPMYSFAESAEPVKTALALTAHATRLANRMTAIYSVPRRFYTLTAALDDVTALQLGQCVTLKHAGKTISLMVLGISGRFADSTANLTLWG